MNIITTEFLANDLVGKDLLDGRWLFWVRGVPYQIRRRTNAWTLSRRHADDPEGAPEWKNEVDVSTTKDLIAAVAECRYEDGRRDQRERIRLELGL